jgi:hypothetical protein
VLLVQDHGLVQKKQSKNQPKIEHNDKVFLKLMAGFLLERFASCSHDHLLHIDAGYPKLKALNRD